MKYHVTLEVHAYTTVTVEADSEEQAREKACRTAVSGRELQVADVGDIIDLVEADAEQIDREAAGG